MAMFHDTDEPRSASADTSERSVLAGVRPRALQVTRSLRVLVVDDDQETRRTISRLMIRAGYVVSTAADGADALQILAMERPDVVLLDVNMPRMNGFDVCRRIKDDPRACLTPVILVTALAETPQRIEGINAGADDVLAKPFAPAELLARVSALIRRRRIVEELEPAETVMMSLALTIEARDQYTRGHSERLVRYAMAVGERLALDEDEMTTLSRGALLHDIGKVGIPDAILLKAGALTTVEQTVMQQHTVIGDRLCSHLQSLARERQIIRSHHERLDGSGYPDGLKGNDIPLLAQIVGIVDLFDAVTSARPYKEARTPAVAIQCLEEEVHRGWKRRDLVETFIDSVQGSTKRTRHVA